MDRRGFIKTAALMAAGGAVPIARAAPAQGATAFAEPEGERFKGMGGAWAAMYTPFTADDKVNEEAIEKLVEYYVRRGLVGLYLTGSTGEGFLLTEEERVTVIRRAVSAARGRLKFIAHVGCFRTKDSVELARKAAGLGVDWISSVAPVYFGQNFAAAYDHYRQISEATDLPFMVYSLGGNGKKIVPDETARFFELKNVHGMKYTGRDYYELGVAQRKLPKPAIFFAGADEQELNAFATGQFSGCIGTTDNEIPAIHVELVRKAAANDFAGAQACQRKICQYLEIAFGSKNPSLWKSVMRYLGLDCGLARAPKGRPYAEAEYEAYAAKLDALGFLRRNDINLV